MSIHRQLGGGGGGGGVAKYLFIFSNSVLKECNRLELGYYNWFQN